jgi:hypothetical protein
MNWISTERTTPAADICEIIRATPLLPAERKAILAAQAKLRSAGELASRFAGKAASERAGKTSPLQQKLWDACDAFTAEPSEATAEAVAEAAARWNASDVICEHFSHSSENARSAISKSLHPVADALLTRAAESMEAQMGEAQKALAAAPSLQKEAAAFAAKVEAARQGVENQRAELAKNPLYWLLSEICIEL